MKNPPSPTETKASSSRYGSYLKNGGPNPKDLRETEENANTRAEIKNATPIARLR